MQTVRRWMFEFLYARRGQTKLWGQDRETQLEFSAGMAWPGKGLRRGAHSEKLEWIEVATELPDGADLDEAHGEAKNRADGEFRRRHPEADLAP